MAKIPACHRLSSFSDRSQFFQFFKWIYQERYYIGRGLYESISDYARYVIFWIVILACKFTFAYFLQIKPLVEPTNIIVQLHDLKYSWHDLVSRGNKNALTILSLWAPVLAIYLMDIHIWYTLLSALVGGVMGARDRLGEIRSIEMLHKRFESFPEAFAKNLSPQRISSRPVAQDSEITKMYASIFSPFWNEIIKSLREEDYISNREMDLLMMPSNCGNLRLVQWPLFLLTSKIMLANDYASDCKDSQYELWYRISKDEYMAYAVKECYYSTERILHSLVDAEGQRWVERLFRDLNDSIAQGSLLVTINLRKLQLVQRKLTGLTGLLIRNETAGLAAGVTKALLELYEVITHEFLAPNLREQFDTWQLLLRARNEGRLFSKIFWPNDPEMVLILQKKTKNLLAVMLLLVCCFCLSLQKEQVKRLHLLLTVKDSAANIPKNLEARRRLQFFTNSLFMDMPAAKPVSEMIPFSVFTPYYSETVLYSMSELCVENEDGISILFYLQKIYPGTVAMPNSELLICKFIIH
jgi:callose synthase